MRDAREPHRGRHPVAVGVELGERGEGNRFQVRFHTVNCLEEIARRNGVALDGVNESGMDGM